MKHSGKALVLGAVVSAIAHGAQATNDFDRFGNAQHAVFVMTNDADENAVIAYERTPYGTLQSPRRYETGGGHAGEMRGQQRRARHFGLPQQRLAGAAGEVLVDVVEELPLRFGELGRAVQREQHFLDHVLSIQSDGLCAPANRASQRGSQQQQQAMVGRAIALERLLHQHRPMPLAICRVHVPVFTHRTRRAFRYIDQQTGRTAVLWQAHLFFSSA